VPVGGGGRASGRAAPAGPGVMRDLDAVADKYEAARAKTTPPACPHGHGPMVPKDYAHYSRVVLDACPKCHGVWLDGGELDRLEGVFAPAKDGGDRPRPRVWR